MKNYYVLTLFPDIIMNGLDTSITGRAKSNGIINFDAINIRDFTKEKHGHVDDYPYGGGAGMVMQPQPIYDAYRYIEDKSGKPDRVVYVTPQGKVFDQGMAKEFAQDDNIVFLCGHYEGVDERILDMIVTDYVSIGDYVLTGGELPAMVMIDAISRMVPGVLSNEVSAQDESFSGGLLEYPQYTRPVEFMGLKVPEVLMSGHHKNIENWRYEQSVIRTQQRRPELLENKTNFEKSELIAKLISLVSEYYRTEPDKIQRFIKVYGYAESIAILEKVDIDAQFMIKTSAIVKGIGKYDLVKLLKKCGYSKDVICRVKYLTAHNVSDNMNEIECQIIVDAENIVALLEEKKDNEKICQISNQMFKTKSGTDMCRKIFGTD